MREFLEKNWAADMGEEQAVRLAVKALLEVVDSGSKNMEVAVMKFQQPVKTIPEDELLAVITEIEKEIEESKKTAQPDANMDT